MNLRRSTLLFLAAATLAVGASAHAGIDEDVRALQSDWELIKYRKPQAEQEKAFRALADTAAAVRAKYANRAEPEIWYGIIVASHAGAKGGLGALALAKDARNALEHALQIDPQALSGSAYASLGSLYYQVPGWPLGFGDDAKARELLDKALTANPEGIDPNYFLGDYLYRQREFDGARRALERALKAAARPDRPLADEGRRREIQELLAKLPAR
jgi:tetratricopeptide (TPR) repeat protein